VRLTELEPEFYRHESRIETYRRVMAEVFKVRPTGPFTDDDIEEVTGPRDWYIPVPIAQAQGIHFLCPVCFAANKRPIGTHGVQVGFVGKAPPGTFSQGKDGKDSRWNVAGTDFTNLTLTPSIALDADVGCKWHGFVTNGEVT